MKKNEEIEECKVDNLYACQSSNPNEFLAFERSKKGIRCVGVTNELQADFLDLNNFIVVKNDIGKRIKLYKVLYKK